MEENKYYTPELNEFHIGFEYEIFNEEDEIWEKKVFPNDYICSGTEDSPDLVELFYSGLKDTRVKYLDREDIEDLGFTFYKESDNRFNGDVIMTYFNDELQLILSHISAKNTVVVYTDKGLNKLSFKIKNKTELKKLLNQLVI